MAKTYKEDFFSKFPNIDRDYFLIPPLCKRRVYGPPVTDGSFCGETLKACIDCWEEEMKEDNND